MMLISCITITHTYHPDDLKLCLNFFHSGYKNLFNNVWLTKQRTHSLAVLNIKAYLRARITTAHFHTKGQGRMTYLDYSSVKGCRAGSTSLSGCCVTSEMPTQAFDLKLLNILHIQHPRHSGIFFNLSYAMSKMFIDSPQRR